MIRNLGLARPETIQLLSVLLRSLLSFSLCLMGCSATHQPNARSAQTGVADKLRGRRAAHDPTAWFAERTTLGLGSYCLTTCTYPDDSEFVPGKTGDYPITFRIASLSSLILALSDGLLRGPCYSSLIHPLLGAPFCGTSPNARSAQTGVADKLRGRGTSHDPTAWFAERTTLGLSSYCLTTITNPALSEFLPSKTGDHPNTFRIASVSSLILALSDGTLRGPCYSSLILTLPGGP